MTTPIVPEMLGCHVDSDNARLAGLKVQAMQDADLICKFEDMDRAVQWLHPPA